MTKYQATPGYCFCCKHFVPETHVVLKTSDPVLIWVYPPKAAETVRNISEPVAIVCPTCGNALLQMVNVSGTPLDEAMKSARLIAP